MSTTDIPAQDFAALLDERIRAKLALYVRRMLPPLASGPRRKAVLRALGAPEDFEGPIAPLLREASYEQLCDAAKAAGILPPMVHDFL